MEYLQGILCLHTVSRGSLPPVWSISSLDSSFGKLFPLISSPGKLLPLSLYLPPLLGLSSGSLSSAALLQLCPKGYPRRQHELAEEAMPALPKALDQVLLLSEYQLPHL